MNTLLYTVALFLGMGLAFAQNQEKPDVHYRVEKEYDQKGNLIRYDSTRISSFSNFSKQFSFFLKKDSLGSHPQIQFTPPFFDLDSLHPSLNLDSVINQQLVNFKHRISLFDSLLRETHFPDFQNPFDSPHPDLSNLKERMDAFERLLQKNSLSVEELLDRFEEADKENSKN